MAIITNQINSDEKTYQGEFYKNLFGEDFEGLSIDRSTDGYTRGILFEQNRSAISTILPTTCIS